VALAIALAAGHPGIARSLVVVSGYAGWARSLPSDVVEQRLAQALTLSGLTPNEFVDTLFPTMFATDPDPDSVERFAASMRAFHPLGFRAMARASAEDLRDALPHIDVPTLLVYGDQHVRAPLPVAAHLDASTSGSSLVVLPGVGHVCNLEAPQRFKQTGQQMVEHMKEPAREAVESVKQAATEGRAVTETAKDAAQSIGQAALDGADTVRSGPPAIPNRSTKATHHLPINRSLGDGRRLGQCGVHRAAATPCGAVTGSPDDAHTRSWTHSSEGWDRG
jgi:hypothetical protein